MSEVIIEFMPKESLHTDYDWANITVEDSRVGKARCKIEGDKLIIYSINIFPEYEGNGYGKNFVEQAKQKFNKIIADRVRFTAIGFWQKLGFFDNNDGNWLYERK